MFNQKTNVMKKAFFACLFVALCSFTSWSQPLLVDNSTSCEYIVDLIQQDPNTCREVCTVKICVKANSSVNVPPCCSSCVWLVGLVTPAKKPCTPCTSNYVKVYNAANPCNNVPSSGTYMHCAGCGPYNLDWNNPGVLKIF